MFILKFTNLNVSIIFVIYIWYIYRLINTERHGALFYKDINKDKA